MGLHCWWLKLFFYLLDVGTSNALVLSREEGKNNNINLVEFKKKLIYAFVGPKIVGICETVTEHKMVRIQDTSHYQCSYCSLFGKTSKRTRYKCCHSTCNMLLCSVGTGRTEQDCFALSHKNEDVRKALSLPFLKMKQKHNHKF